MGFNVEPAALVNKVREGECVVDLYKYEANWIRLLRYKRIENRNVLVDLVPNGLYELDMTCYGEVQVAAWSNDPIRFYASRGPIVGTFYLQERIGEHPGRPTIPNPHYRPGLPGKGKHKQEESKTVVSEAQQQQQPRVKEAKQNEQTIVENNPMEAAVNEKETGISDREKKQEEIQPAGEKDSLKKGEKSGGSMATWAEVLLMIVAFCLTMHFGLLQFHAFTSARRRDSIRSFLHKMEE